MKIILEHFYNVLESILLVFFVSSYFDVRNKYSKTVGIGITFIVILLSEELINMFEIPWQAVLIGLTLIIAVMAEFFYSGSMLEHLFLSIIAVTLLAVVDVVLFTTISHVLGVSYGDLVVRSTSARFFTVLIIKTVYFIICSLIVTFKKKKAILLRKGDIIILSATLIVSCIVILLFRNIIFEIDSHYITFLIALFCILLLNIGQYYILLYISKKNINEKNVTLLQKQIEMQTQSISLLEEKYDETAKLRHDFKNYVSCALNLAETDEKQKLIDYLNELADTRINSISSYINLKRKVLGAVINSKLGVANNKGYAMQCIITDELETISEIDLGIIIANLLDNAIEACDKNIGNSEILVKMWSNEGYYCIEISNTVETDVLENNPELKTNKESKELHGIGLKSVRGIVEKYDGILNFNQKSNRFYVYILLKKQI